MNKTVKVKCPAKINLTLEVLNRREDGFHNIKSIMQLINLYDYLTIKVFSSDKNEISLRGNSMEIPYDENNIAYKAAELYIKSAKLNNVLIEIYIEKNIPIAAGLAGGSTDAAGTLLGLNHIFRAFHHSDLNKLCAQLGSDLNVCLNGGCTLATSRGEVTQSLPTIKSNVTLIKPKNLGISAKEAYEKYALKKFKLQNNMTEKVLEAMRLQEDITPFLYNDLENAVFDDYAELQMIKQVYPRAIMSGSGPTYFLLENLLTSVLDESYQFINNLKFISTGVSIIED